MLPIHVIEHRAQNAADQAGFCGLPHFASCGHIFLQLVSEPGDGEGLQPDATRSGERGEEDAVASENEVLDAADHRDLERDAGREGADVARMDEQGFTLLEVAGYDLAGELDPRQALAADFLQQEAVVPVPVGISLNSSRRLVSPSKETP